MTEHIVGGDKEKNLNWNYFTSEVFGCICNEMKIRSEKAATSLKQPPFCLLAELPRLICCRLEMSSHFEEKALPWLGKCERV